MSSHHRPPDTDERDAAPATAEPPPPPRGLLHRVFALDLRSLAALRVGLAATLLLSLALQAPHIGAFFTDGGIQPRALIVGGGPRYDPWRLSLHLMGGEWAAQAALLAAGAFCAAGMLVGWRTRLMTLLSWLLLMSLHNRNILVVSAGDGLLRILLLWAAFLPLGARFSVDAARVARVARAAVPADARERPAEVSGVAGAALLLQLCLMYWFSAWFKQTPAWTTERTAVALALGIDELARPAIAGPLSRHPGLLARMTTATLAMEVAAPLAALVPVAALRTAVVLTMVGFHASLGACLALGVFPLVCISAWMAFLPGVFWDRLGVRLRRLLSHRPEWAFSRGQKRSDPAPAASDAAPGPPPSPVRLAPTRGETACAAALLALGLFANFYAAGPTLQRFPALAPVHGAAVLLGINQRWSMFDSPPPSGGWYVFEGRLADGTVADLWRGTEGVRYEKPADPSAALGTHQWFKYLEMLRQAGTDADRIAFSNHFCRRWDATHPPSRRVVAFDVFYMEERTPLDGSPPGPPRKHHLVRHRRP